LWRRHDAMRVARPGNCPPSADEPFAFQLFKLEYAFSFVNIPKEAPERVNPHARDWTKAWAARDPGAQNIFMLDTPSDDLVATIVGANVWWPAPGYGGGGGGEFADDLTGVTRLAGLDIWSGSLIDAIRAKYERGDGTTFTSNKYGGPGGLITTIELE